jgi:uncharacterized protein (TIGR02145 family)
MDDAHRCKARQNGAYNWEAWIKDSRDGELYRIVFMPDNKWGLAQNVKYAGTGVENTRTDCTPDKCGRLYTGAQMSSTYTGSIGASGYGAGKQGICPNNWILPIYNDWRPFVDAIDKVTLTPYAYYDKTFLLGISSLVNLRLVAHNNPTLSGNDYYGWANANFAGSGSPDHEGWRGNTKALNDWELEVAFTSKPSWYHSQTEFSLAQGDNNADRPACVRCFRQL